MTRFCLLPRQSFGTLREGRPVVTSLLRIRLGSPAIGHGRLAVRDVLQCIPGNTAGGNQPNGVSYEVKADLCVAPIVDESMLLRCKQRCQLPLTFQALTESGWKDVNASNGFKLKMLER